MGANTRPQATLLPHSGRMHARVGRHAPFMRAPEPARAKRIHNTSRMPRGARKPMARRGHPVEVAWPSGGHACGSPSGWRQIQQPKRGTRFDTAHQAMAAAFEKGNRQGQLLVNKTHSIASVIGRQPAGGACPGVPGSERQTRHLLQLFGWGAVLRSGCSPMHGRAGQPPNP